MAQRIHRTEYDVNNKKTPIHPPPSPVGSGRGLLGKEVKYVLLCPKDEPPPESAWVTYKDFKDAAPLIHYFTTNVAAPIIKTFSGKIGALSRALCFLGGVPSPMFKDSYDLSMMLHTLPKIPMIINFNDRDDEFPATCSVLYQKNSEHFFDMESLAITGTCCTEKLIEGVEK